MVWFLVDDVLPFHERVLRAGNAAMGLWVRGGSWCSGQLTDGFIPADVARTMGTAAEIRKLVQVGLWSPAEKDDQVGYLFHAWGQDGTGQKRQPTKVEVEEKRRIERERKAAMRAAKKAKEDAEAARRVPSGVPVGHPADVRPESRRVSALPDLALPALPLLAPLEGGAPPVDNPGDETGPPARCPAHAGLARPPKCGACKDARLEHEAWEQTHPAPAPAAPARRIPWDPSVYCEHGQILDACEICEYEAGRAGVVTVGPWERTTCDDDAAPSRDRI